jgi:osmotically-inducible protein OsmY
VLDWNVSIPKGAVQVEVSHGLVVLSGQVDWEFQRRAADEAMHKLGGIVGVVNNISLRPRVSPSDVKMRIQTALERHADIEAAKVHVDVDGGKVTLTGKVKTWNERDLIESAVWAAPGVRTIEDRVSIG